MLRALALCCAFLVGAVSALAAVWVSRDLWRGVLFPEKEKDEAKDAHAHDDRITLSPQAIENLRLDVKQVRPTTYPRTIEMPGTIVEQRGRSDRGVPTPLGGIVTRILAVPGDTV